MDFHIEMPCDICKDKGKIEKVFGPPEGPLQLQTVTCHKCHKDRMLIEQYNKRNKG